MKIIDTYNKLIDDHELLQNIIKITTNAIFVIDLQGKFVFLNNAVSIMTGYSVDELKGVTFSVLFTNDTFSKINDQFRKTATHSISVPLYETQIVCKGGNKRFVALSLTPLINNEKITCVLIVAEDITKRKHAEIQLQLETIDHDALSHISRIVIQSESEQKIYDQIPQLISRFFEFDIVSIELYDKVTDEIIFVGNTGVPVSDKYPASDKKPIRKAAAGTVSGDVIKNGKSVMIPNSIKHSDYKFNLLKKLNIKGFFCLPMQTKYNVIGTLCLGSKQKEYLHQAKNIILQTIANIIAQTIEYRRAKKELKKYQQHLEELVNKRTEQLKTVQEKLIHTAKLSAIGKLSASIAHEFNNPICGIRNVLERINERISKGVNLNDTHKDLTALAIKECNRIADMTRKLHDFHRPSSGKISKINIHEAIDEIVLMSEKIMTERNIELTKHYSHNILEVDAVGDQIRQVILNIIQNAEEAIQETGGKITITTEMEDSNVKIHIRDTGSGIPPKNMATIFEPFFTTKPAVKGTGLGLAISYGIIKKHGGNIEVKSSLTNGTTFTIILPITSNR